MKVRVLKLSRFVHHVQTYVFTIYQHCLMNTNVVMYFTLNNLQQLMT